MRRREQQGEGGEMVEREDGPLPADNDPVLDDTTPPPAEDEPVVPGPSRVGCRTELRGWAGAHLHGAVRPRRRAAGRGRPPGRWC
ncbi:hypothetical protein ACIA5C_28860 [Actinoplanes sp. NPDC051343]|uniref:hypothetical protein n=1 Tax=Actinoplanes sp. NPDC051343 TaxID=3363906 RepID=UPI0037937D17